MSGSDALKCQARRLLWRASRRLYWRVVRSDHQQTFSIGIYDGRTPLELCPPISIRNPVLTSDQVDDVPASFVADPFILQVEQRWYMFFEVMNSIYRRGQIGLATSADGYRWSYQCIVLDEPFHLAYPFVFEWRGDVYMVPDSPECGIRLYKASGFPDTWDLVHQITTEMKFSDSTLFEHGDRWWMFSSWVAERGDAMSLRLFHADSPIEQWHEHPESPVVIEDQRISRSAGRVQIIDGIPHRFAQDCSERYGERVNSFRIDKLSTVEYSETELSTVLNARDEWWNEGGMHHLDAWPLGGNCWIASVDGWHPNCG